jgi:peptide/nickel transport system permease protein
MVLYITNRVLQSVAVMLVTAFVCFILFNYVGDPINNMVGQETTIHDREALREKLGLNDPNVVQFFRFIKNALRGDFGISYRLQRPVKDLILERLPATLELVLISAVLALVLGIPLGIYTGINRDTWTSRAILAGSLLGVSLPTFIIGILLIFIFSVNLGLLPSYGRGEVVRIFDWWSTGFLTAGGLKAIILPAITLCLYQLTLILRIVRAEMMEVLLTDYIKFARARGLTERAINFDHALKNTLIPVITVAGLQIGSLIAFSIITETVFQWPGMGSLFIQAVHFVDIPIMVAYLVIVALVFVTINFIVDLLYFVIDPKLRMSRHVVGNRA